MVWEGKCCPHVPMLSTQYKWGETNSSVAQARLMPWLYRLQHSPYEWCSHGTVLGKCLFVVGFFQKKNVVFVIKLYKFSFKFSKKSPELPLPNQHCPWFAVDPCGMKSSGESSCFPVSVFLHRLVALWFSLDQACVLSLTRVTLGNPPTAQTFLNIVCWLTGTRSFLLLHAGLQKRAGVCVWQPHALGHGGSSVLFLLQNQINNNKIRKLLSERGQRQLWRGISVIKKRCLQPGGSWELCTQALRG